MAPAGRQRTFELVPNAPLGPQRVGNDPSPIFSKPPMTTRQAKKLHNQKNKGPKLSKAEMRRIELMEQDRIRKEFEKEKAQARARAVRDKKKAKEEKEKEERKRKGLPLKDIHPSQDTISRFLSRVGMGIGLKLDSTFTNARLDTVEEGDAETATEAGDSGTDAGDQQEDDSFDKENQAPVDDDSDPERKAKKIRLSPPEDQAGDRRSPAASQRQAGPVARIVQQTQVESYTRASSADTDDPIIEALLENQILEDLEQASSRIKATREADEEQNPTVGHVPQPAVPAVPVVPVSPAPKEYSESRTLLPGPQPPQRTTTPVTRNFPPPETHTVSRVPPHLGDTAFKKPTSLYVRPRPPIKPPSFREPNGPPKFKSPAARPNYSSERPKFLPKHVNPAQHRHNSAIHQSSKQSNADNLPTSTQAFLFNHADELFPSATQEARELADDFVPEPPKPRAAHPRLSVNGLLYRSGAASLPCSRSEPTPLAPEPAAPAAGISFDSSCLSTQDLLISTQDFLDIDTPSKPVSISAAKVLLPVVDAEQPRAKADRAVIQESTVPATCNLAAGNHKEDVRRPEGQTPVTRNSGATASAVAYGSCGSHPSTRSSQRQVSSCPSSYKVPSQQTVQRKQGDPVAAAARPLRSSYQRHAAVAQQRSTPASSKNSISAPKAPKPVTTPKNPPSKKRMFGSSGPGPEGLVAMERSYQEMRCEQRVQKEQLRAQERLVGTTQRAVEPLDLDLTEFADEFLDDDLGLSLGNVTTRRQGDKFNKKDTGATDGQPPQPKMSVRAQGMSQAGIGAADQACATASQETDYGDFDGDDLDFLKADTSWLDEDLNDI